MRDLLLYSQDQDQTLSYVEVVEEDMIDPYLNAEAVVVVEPQLNAKTVVVEAYLNTEAVVVYSFSHS